MDEAAAMKKKNQLPMQQQSLFWKPNTESFLSLPLLWKLWNNNLETQDRVTYGEGCLTTRNSGKGNGQYMLCPAIVLVEELFYTFR